MFMRCLVVATVLSLGVACATPRPAAQALQLLPGWGARSGAIPRSFEVQLQPEVEAGLPDVVLRRAPQPSLGGTLFLEFREPDMVTYRLTIRDAPYERFTRAVIVQRQPAGLGEEGVVLFDGVALSGWFIQVRGEGSLLRRELQLVEELLRGPQHFQVRVEGTTAGGTPLVLAGEVR
jgi:hypothetical protein